MEMFLQLIVSGMANGAIYALIGLTICIIFKGTDVINFAVGEVIMISAFVAFTFSVILKWPVYISAIITGFLFPILLGFSIERFAQRPLIPAGHLPMVMGTFALLFALRGLSRFIWGSDVWALPSLFGHKRLSINFGVGSSVISEDSLFMLIISLIVMIVFFLFFKVTKLGKMMRASQENTLGASIVGIDISRMFSFSWIIGCMIGSWAAVLLAPASLVYAEMGSKLMFKGLAATILGGFGFVPGAIIGGFLMGIVECLSSGYISTTMTDLSSLLVVFLIIIIRPTGIFGKKAVVRL
jgi:branched-chain amino acid transport system permease protein